MESLAALAMAIVLSVYGSGIIAFGLSWIRRPWAKATTFVMAGIATATGAWLGFTLTPGNGIFIAAVPIALAAFSAWNTVRRSR